MPDLYTKPGSNLPPLYISDPNKAAELGLVPYQEPAPQGPPPMLARPPEPPPPSAPMPHITGPATPEQANAAMPPPNPVAPNPSGDPTEALKLKGAQIGGGESPLQIPQDIGNRRAQFNQGLNAPGGPGSAAGPGAELRNVDLDLLLKNGRNGPPQAGPSYGPVRQVKPERMAEVGYSRQYAPGPSEADADAYKGAVYNRLAGIAGAGAQQSGMMERDVGAQENFYQKQMDDLAIEQAKRAQLDAKLRTMQSDVDLRRKEAERLQDPTAENFWKEKGVAGHILAAMTMAIGGYLQGSGRTTENEGTKLVDRAINQWIADARTKYDRKDKQFKESNNAYAEALARYGTPEAAEADMRMRGYAAYTNLLQARAKRVPIAEYQNAVKDAVNEGLVKVNEWQMNLSQIQAGQITEEHRLLPAQYSGGGAPKYDNFTVRLPNGDTGYTRKDPEETRLTQKRLDFHTFAAKEYQRLAHLLSKGGGYTSAEQAEIETIAMNITKREEQETGQGVLREGEKDEELRARGASFFTLNKPERLRERARMNAELLQQTVRNHVFKSPARDQYYLGPQVQTQPGD